MSKFFLWGFNFMADKTLCICACFEIIPAETEQKNIDRCNNGHFKI